MKRMLPSIVVLSLILVLAIPSHAKPAVVTFDVNQAQFQWRTPSWGCSQANAWCSAYQNYPTSFEVTVTGRVLHTSIGYSPSVTELQGESTVYVFEERDGVWIQREGTVQYTSPYSGLTITEYWRGYLSFNTPSNPTSDFTHGVGYQWGYVYGVDEGTVKAKYPYAVWDETMGAWLVGFSVYLWDPGTQAYDTTRPYTSPPFPAPFIEPVPASDYNPMRL